MFNEISRLRDAAHTNMKEFPERDITYYKTLCGHMDAAWPSCMALLRANPDDIRAQGWVVAVHNDYRLDGKAHTFWLFTKGAKAVKGEGTCDGDALDQVRKELARMGQHIDGGPMMQHAEYGSMRPAVGVLRDLLECQREFMPKTQIKAAADIIEEQDRLIIDLRCNLACATCLFHPTPDDPCPHKDRCCYGMKRGFGEADNNFWSGVDSALP